MARLVEDSDDEFPDLAEIIHRKDISGKLASCQATTTKTEAVKPRNKLTKGQDTENRKQKIKKRTLKQTSVNPLLRPLFNSAATQNKTNDVERLSRTTDPRRKSQAKNLSPETAYDDTLQQHVSSENVKEVYSDQPPVAVKQVVQKETKAPKKKTHDANPEEEGCEGASGLSNFVHEDSITLDGRYVVEASPGAGRSVQGRRRNGPRISDFEDLEGRMGKLKVDEDIFSNSQKISKDLALREFVLDYGLAQPPARASKRSNEGIQTKIPKAPEITSKPELPASDEEDSYTLSYSPSESKPRKAMKEARFMTPPGSPDLKPKRLQSPKKQFLPLPSTPHRSSMDGFWQQDVVNDWNDEHSPQKILFPWVKPGNGPTKQSLTQDRTAKEAKKAFSISKHSLAKSFLNELDTKITKGEISKLSASTGGVKIIWSKKLNTTAGRAIWRRETIKSQAAAPDGKTTYRHHAAIELAEKVIDDEERLMNVIAHEFCHLANFMVSNVKTNPHGKEFKAWAAKCSNQFGDRGIEVTTKHSYPIHYKYVWECSSCGTEFKRHSKSIDPTRHQCGSCKCKLVQTKPVPRANVGTAKVGEYQLFVKENMKRLKEENPGSPQKEIMGLVAREYQISKAAKLCEGGKTTETSRAGEPIGSDERTPGYDVGTVVRKFDFLDLTSP